MNNTPAAVFETHAIVELFGHARIAGRVSEQVIAGQGFVRVDVPELPAIRNYPASPGFTRMFGPSAIYSITPVSEEIALQAALNMRVTPVNVYLAALPAPSEDDDLGFDEGEDD